MAGQQNKRSMEIGGSISIDSQHPIDYIRRIGKLDYFKDLRGTPEEKIETHKKIFEKLKEFRLGLYLIGVDIGYKRIHWLSALELINASMKNSVATTHMNLVQKKYVSKFYITSQGEFTSQYVPEDNEIENYVYEGSSAELDVNDLEIANAIKKSYLSEDIKRSDWAIDDVFELPDDVYVFIQNFNRGFQHFKSCERFDKYRQQAYVWLNRNYTFDASWSEEKQIEFLTEERERCLTNTLYLANKYLWYKDSDDRFKGEKKFKAWKAQECVLFLIDLGLSLIIGKLRQIGFTTVIGGVMGLRTMLSKNFYCKMVAQKENKSEEIFEHKIKYAISKCDEHMKTTIPNWSTDKVKFGFSLGKGAESSSESLFEVAAPTADAINAGTPSITLLDEIGFMKLFGAIIGQGRPTMFKYDSTKNKMLMTKQVIAWGTGGKTGGAGSAMEVEWKAAKEAFASKNFRHGLIPLFINYYAKPGHSDEHYLAEKAFYYAKKKMVGEEDPKIVFHQSFPITEDDMFLQSSDTVISVASINLHIERINRKIAEGKHIEKRGYFEPIYNMEKKRGEDSYVPYEIIGSRFIPADQSLIDEDSPFACITILKDPDLNWENRYYKGSDPIFTSSGHSKFASDIYDAKDKVTAAYLNFKSEDYRYEYLQSLLLNLYYSRTYGARRMGIPELLEFNVGGEYYNFCRELGYGNIFTGNKMLPSNMQTTTIDIGINKRGTNSVMIVNRLEELLLDYADKIDDIEFWIQLKTFVKKQTATGFKYEPENKKIHYDDKIDAKVYSKINADSYSHHPIKYITQQDSELRESKKLRYYYDKGFNLRLGSSKQIARQRQRA